MNMPPDFLCECLHCGVTFDMNTVPIIHPDNGCRCAGSWRYDSSTCKWQRAELDTGRTLTSEAEDAARYRFLRGSKWPCGPTTEEEYIGAELDAAIDAAIKAKP